MKCSNVFCVLQAFKNQICLDLSPNHMYDGRLTGHRVVNWDVKVHALYCLHGNIGGG